MIGASVLVRVRAGAADIGRGAARRRFFRRVGVGVASSGEVCGDTPTPGLSP